MACATASSSRAVYYCHQCESDILPDMPAYTCPNCASGFIEEVTPSFQEDRQQQRAQVRSPHSLLGLMHPREDIDYDDEADDDDDEEEELQRRGRRNTRNRSRRHHFRPRYSRNTIRPYVQMIGSEMGSADGGPLDHLIHQLLSNLLADPSVMASIPGIHGDPGDYVVGETNFDNIITQLMNRMDNYGPPAASSQEIAALAQLKISAEQVERNLQCSVCLEEYALDETVLQLPCSHLFHGDCIKPWLIRHGTCPICRKNLTGQDTSTQDFITSENTSESTQIEDEESSNPGPSTSNSNAH